MDQSGVLLWVKAEPFIVGALPIPPPSKFSLHYLKKIATYVRTRATERAYPRLSWSTWRHIACGKLQLTKDIAWLYFEIFDSLSMKSPEERLEWSEVLSNCVSEDEIEKQRNQVWTDICVCLITLGNKLLNFCTPSIVWGVRLMTIMILKYHLSLSSSGLAVFNVFHECVLIYRPFFVYIKAVMLQESWS